VVMAWDVNQETLNSIQSGKIDSTIVQKPFTMGYVGLKALDELFHNPPAQLGRNFATDAFSPFPAFVDTGTSLVEKSNVDSYIVSASNN
jgi:ribose transport system substrate-binding protein